MTEMFKSHRSWHGETGQIDEEMPGRYLKGAVSPAYYIAGPPEMVKGIHAEINETGIDDDDIRAEEFARLLIALFREGPGGAGVFRCRGAGDILHWNPACFT